MYWVMVIWFLNPNIGGGISVTQISGLTEIGCKQQALKIEFESKGTSGAICLEYR